MKSVDSLLCGLSLVTKTLFLKRHTVVELIKYNLSKTLSATNNASFTPTVLCSGGRRLSRGCGMSQNLGDVSCNDSQHAPECPLKQCERT